MSRSTSAKSGAEIRVTESLSDLHKSADDKVRDLIQWYDVKNKRKKFWSVVYRALTIASSTIGILIPVLAPVLPVNWRDNAYHYGYFSTVLAVFFIAVDRQFGFTSSWVRTIKASRQLETVRADFRTNWSKLAFSVPRPADEVFAQCIKDFVMQARAVVDKEADTWATETLANFNQLEKTVASGAEEARKRYEDAVVALRAGAIQLTLKNPPSVGWSCSISVNGQIRKQNWSAPTCGIADVVPGNIELLVEAQTVNDERWIGSVVTAVASGPPTAVFVELSRVDRPVEKALGASS
jgi:hypothetical protein